MHEKIVRKVQVRSLTRWVALGKPSNQEAQIRMILNGSDPMVSPTRFSISVSFVDVQS